VCVTAKTLRMVNMVKCWCVVLSVPYDSHLAHTTMVNTSAPSVQTKAARGGR
jgi:hypothetical protein